MNIVIKKIKHQEQTEREKEAVTNCQKLCFDDRAHHPWAAFDFEWNTPDWHFHGVKDANLACYLSITNNHCVIGNDMKVTIAGIGSVMTDLPYRGHGIAGTLVQAASEFIKNELRPDFGLLFCNPKLAPYYAKYGWTEILSPVYFPHSSGEKLWQENAMYLSCEKPVWPQGNVKLLNNIF